MARGGVKKREERDGAKTGDVAKTGFQKMAAEIEVAKKKKAEQMKAWRDEMKSARQRTMGRKKAGEVVVKTPKGKGKGKEKGKGKGKGKHKSKTADQSATADGEKAAATETDDVANKTEARTKRKKAESVDEADPDGGDAPRKTKKPIDAEAVLQNEATEEPVKKKKQKTNDEKSVDNSQGTSTDPETYKVCVAGVPHHIPEERLRKDFGVCGEVISLRLLRDKETKTSRGIAFISFATEAGLEAALKYDGEDYGGRSLWVKVADKKGNEKQRGADSGSKGKGRGAAPGEKPDGCTSVILKGLAFSVTEADVTKAFKECGDGPTNVNILTDRETGVSKGMAFVDFDDEDAVDEAIKLHGSELRGRCFTMDYATPREKGKGPGEKPAGCISVVVKGLVYSVTEDDLTKAFRKCGSGPVNIRMAMDKAGESRGIAFIDFDSEEAVDEAIKLHGKELQGRRIVMDYALPRDESGKAVSKTKSAAKGPKKPAGCTSIIVKDLAEAVTEKTLLKAFKACGGGPRSVNLVTDEETGEKTGKAFINFSSEDAVDEAIELNGTELKGQVVRIGYVKPSSVRQKKRVK